MEELDPRQIRRKLKATDVLILGLDSIKSELQSLDNYIEEACLALTIKQKEIEKQYDEYLKEDELDEDTHTHYLDEFQRYHEFYPVLTYNFNLVTQFAFFETRFRFICEIFEKRRFSDVRFTHLKGRDIEKYKLYVELIGGVDFNPLMDVWNKIMNCDFEDTSSYSNDIAGIEAFSASLLK